MESNSATWRTIDKRFGQFDPIESSLFTFCPLFLKKFLNDDDRTAGRRNSGSRINIPSTITDLDETLKASVNELQEERAGEVIFEDENVTPLDDEENNSVIIADSDDEDDIEHFNGNMNTTLTDLTDPSIEAQTVNLG